MRFIDKRSIAAPLGLTFALMLNACGSATTDNRSLYSVNQPVIERSNFTLDVQSNGGGLPISEKQRLADWFESMNIRYGDRIAIDDGTAGSAVQSEIAAIAGRYGLLLSEGAPLTTGAVPVGYTRIVVTRSTASVPGCPDWSRTAEFNPKNATSSNYGCSVNSNLAAMIANPEDLVQGQQGTGETVVTTSTKAIRSYRDQTPTGAEGLPQVSTGGNQ